MWRRLRSLIASLLRRLRSSSAPLPREGRGEAGEESEAGEGTPIDWPIEWTDRHGQTRRFAQPVSFYDERHDELIPADPSVTWISARRIQQVTGSFIERVLKYHQLTGPDGTTLPDWWRCTESYEYLVAEDEARRIVACIRDHERRSAARRRRLRA